MKISALKNSNEFHLVNKTGKKIHNQHCILVLSKCFSVQNSCFFLGMKVSKKISKKAVIRNKIKRRIRHIIRKIVKSESFKANSNTVIVVVKRSFAYADFQVIFDHFYNILNKN